MRVRQQVFYNVLSKEVIFELGGQACLVPLQVAVYYPKDPVSSGQSAQFFLLLQVYIHVYSYCFARQKKEPLQDKYCARVEPATHTKLEHAQAANAKLGRRHALFAHSVSFGDTAALKHISSSNFSLAHMCIDGGVHVH
jgi:hypothetical protein